MRHVSPHRSVCGRIAWMAAAAMAASLPAAALAQPATQRKPTWPSVGEWAIVAVLVVAGLVLIKLIVELTGTRCPLCPNIRLTPLRRARRETRDAALAWLREHDVREPDVRRCFVCRQCHTLLHGLDSREEDLTPIPVNDRKVYSRSGMADTVRQVKQRCEYQAACHVCDTKMPDSDPEFEYVDCPTCGARHEWQTVEPLGLRALVCAQRGRIEQP